jgi:hypothetical protein
MFERILDVTFYTLSTVVLGGIALLAFMTPLALLGL